MTMRGKKERETERVSRVAGRLLQAAREIVEAEDEFRRANRGRMNTGRKVARQKNRGNRAG